MSNNSTTPSNQDLQRLSDDILGIAEVIENLPTAARIDATPKVERLQVMEKALFRDIAEAADPNHGADAGTVENLYAELRRETTNLRREMEVIDQGNPTTVSAVGDAAMEAIEAAASTVTEKLRDGIAAVGDRFSSDSK